MDVSNKTLLLCFVRVECKGELQEELFCLLKLPGGTTSSEIFEALNRISWNTELNGKNVLGYVQMVPQT